MIESTCIKKRMVRNNGTTKVEIFVFLVFFEITEKDWNAKSKGIFYSSNLINTNNRLCQKVKCTFMDYDYEYRKHSINRILPQGQKRKIIKPRLPCLLHNMHMSSKRCSLNNQEFRIRDLPVRQGGKGSWEYRLNKTIIYRDVHIAFKLSYMCVCVCVNYTKNYTFYDEYYTKSFYFL